MVNISIANNVRQPLKKPVNNKFQSKIILYKPEGGFAEITVPCVGLLVVIPLLGVVVTFCSLWIG